MAYTPWGPLGFQIQVAQCDSCYPSSGAGRAGGQPRWASLACPDPGPAVGGGHTAGPAKILSPPSRNFLSPETREGRSRI